MAVKVFSEKFITELLLTVN